MPSADTEKKSSFWTILTTLFGLVISLSGNIVQYRSLEAKRTELAQAQQKIDTAQNASEARERAIESRLSQLHAQMASLDSQLEQQKLEERRGAAGLAYAPANQHGYAMAIIRNAREEQTRIQEEQRKLQQTIDSTEAAKINCLSN
ncbi:MAG TPA: hypothetical protein VGJ30_19315 [Candidatus Angelobacter sp.]